MKKKPRNQDSLYPLKVSNSDLHFLRYITEYLIDRWDELSLHPQFKNVIQDISLLISKTELKDFSLRVNDTIYKLVPALRHMRIYDITLSQMEAKREGQVNKKKGLNEIE